MFEKSFNSFMIIFKDTKTLIMQLNTLELFNSYEKYLIKELVK